MVMFGPEARQFLKEVVPSDEASHRSHSCNAHVSAIVALYNALNLNGSIMYKLTTFINGVLVSTMP
jgi:cytochrome b